MQNFMELNMKNVFHPRTVKFRFWDLETIFGNLGLKASSSHKFRTLASIFRKKDLILSRIISQI